MGDGSKLTLVPTVEAGLMSQASRPEQSVMQALESLTETQVRPAPPCRPAGSQAQCPAPLGSPGLFVLPGGLSGGDGRPPRLRASSAWSSSFLFLLPPALTT